MGEMDAAIQEFLVESDENLSQVERDLVDFEGHPEQQETLASIFRAVHTIKGTCSFLGYTKLESLAHTGETLLSLVRDGELALSHEIASALLNTVDAVRQMLAAIEQTGNDGTEEYQDLKNVLIALQKGEASPMPIETSEASAPSPESLDAQDAPEDSSAPVQSGDVEALSPEVSVASASQAEPSSVKPQAESPAADMEGMDAAVQEFLVESDENLSAVERDLVDFEGHPEQQETLASIFRAVHTIKGTCSFLGYSKLESLAHTGETLLSLVRDGDLALTNEIASALLTMVDAIRQILAVIEQTGNDGTEEYQDLKNVLIALQNGEALPTPTEFSEALAPSPASLAAQDAPEASDTNPEQLGAVGTAAPEVSVALASQPVPSSVKPKAAPAAAPSEHRGPSAAESSIRVDVGLLDKLMNMVGELVLTRNQIGQGLSKLEDPSLLHASQRLSLITTELQEGIMKTRMQQIGNIWSKFPRVVRDIAPGLGKEIRLEMEGKETELDKTLIEAIKDPLTHLVRNSVDHGIEIPSVREERGKPREGRLLLRAYHEGGQVNIEITDDGGGINVERVTEIAIKKGVVTAEQVAKMPERELLGLIFQPGFSTAEKVTNVSGRGVGMDVVKTNIEKIGGTIDISSKPGHGSTFRLKVPLTLAIIPALIVTSAGERFAIPQASLLELVRVDGENGAQNIECIQGAPVYRSRGQLLPLVYLNKVIDLGAQPHSDEEGAEYSTASNIVVLQADSRRFGVVVDEVNDTEEIVVKPLGKQLKGISIYAGATIMGDGKVALILDVQGLAQKANLRDRDKDQAEIEHVSSATDQNLQTLLLVKVGSQGRVAIPVSHIARLEEMPDTVKEAAGGQEVVQYRGTILPVLRLSTLLASCGYATEEHDGTFQMVVVRYKGRQVGIMVDRIMDIMDVALGPLTRSEQPGILGSAVVQERVTDLLDIETVWQNTLMNEAELEAADCVGV